MASGGVTVALFSLAIDSGHVPPAAYIGLVFFAITALIMLAVLWPAEWTFRTDPMVILDWDSDADVEAELARWCARFWEENDARLRVRTTWYRIGLAFYSAQVVVWFGALAS